MADHKTEVAAAVDAAFEALMKEFELVAGGRPKAEIQTRIRLCLVDLAVTVYNLGA